MWANLANNLKKNEKRLSVINFKKLSELLFLIIYFSGETNTYASKT